MKFLGSYFAPLHFCEIKADFPTESTVCVQSASDRCSKIRK